MAATLRHYARALYEASLDKSKVEVAQLTEQLFALLKEKGLAHRAHEVVAEVERIDDQASGRIKACVTSAHRLDDETLEKMEKLVRHRTGAKEVAWEKIVDKEILGGVILTFGDTVLDMSMAQAVSALAEEIRK